MELKFDQTKFETVVRNPLTTAVVADCDGTMAPFRDDPADVVVPPDMQEACWAAAEVFGQMAVISSRPADWLMSQIGVPDLLYFGQKGAEVYWHGTEVWRNSEYFGRAPELAALVAGMEPWLDDAGAYVQVQDAIRTVHFKYVAPDRRPQLIASVQDEAGRRGFPVTVQADVIDLMPAPSVGKGIAGLMLVVGTMPGGQLEAAAPPHRIERLVWAGDDVSDADAWNSVSGQIDVYRVGVRYDDRDVEAIERLADTTVDGVDGWCQHLNQLTAAARGE